MYGAERYDGPPYDGAGRYDGAPYEGAGRYDGAANANALFSGGGFMPSQATAAPESSGGVFSKGRNAQTLLPLTVKQIMDAAQSSDDKSNFAVDGVEVSTVRLVGRMLNKVERVTDVAFVLDDGTGRIDVNRWENESSDTKEMADVNNGNYVIVNGGLKGFQGKRHVVAYSVRRVIDFNDVTHHFLHCIHVHLQLTGSKPHVNANIGNPNPPNQFRLANNQAPVSGNTAGNDANNLVLSVFNDPAVIHLEHGLTRQYVINCLKNLPEEAVRKVIDYHVEVGNIYNTIDDNHFRSVMNG